MQNLDVLLPAERAELADLLLNYSTAKTARNYGLSDHYRHWIARWDTSLGVLQGLPWSPCYERRAHRIHRAYLRCLTYNIAVFPWDRDVEGFKLSSAQSALAIAESYVKSVLR